MNRLQKKCLIASFGFHLFLGLLLVFGPAFLGEKKESVHLPLLTVIPAHLIDEALSGGGTPSASPPASPPAPPTPQPDPPRPAPRLQPERRPTPPAPEPKRPDPTPVVKPVTKPVARPKEKPAEPKPTRPRVNLTPAVRVTRPSTPAPARDSEAERTRELAKARQSVINNLSENLSGSTSVEPAGPGGAAYANYDQVIKSLYTARWIPPEAFDDEQATVQARITITRDGRVLSAITSKRSGISALDKSVDAVLDRIRKVPPFPEGAKDSERTFILNFNLKAKRLLG